MGAIRVGVGPHSTDDADPCRREALQDVLSLALDLVSVSVQCAEAGLMRLRGYIGGVEA